MTKPKFGPFEPMRGATGAAEAAQKKSAIEALPSSRRGAAFKQPTITKSNRKGKK